MPLLWHNMTWEEIGAQIAAGVDGALLPIGATEQHGPHLGCGMDSEIAMRLCETVAEQTQVFLLPPLLYGCSIGHSRRWPGTIALQPKTLIDVIKDMGDWLAVNGDAIYGTRKWAKMPKVTSDTKMYFTTIK